MAERLKISPVLEGDGIYPAVVCKITNRKQNANDCCDNRYHDKRCDYYASYHVDTDGNMSVVCEYE